MKTKQNKTLALVIMFAATLTISSCQKEKIVSKVEPSEKIFLEDQTFIGVQRTIIFEITRNLSFKTESCEIITYDTVSGPHVKTIDYGTGCIDNEGKTRKGQIIIAYDTENIKYVTGANAYTTFNNFFISDVQIDGSFNLHNDGINGNGNYVFTMSGKYDEILGNNAGTESVIGQQVMEWTSGADTPNDATDNEFAYTGSIDVTSTNGDVSTLSILQPLIEKRAPGCERFYVSGIQNLQVTGQSDRYLDYGDGTCDDQAVETVDGVSTPVTLQ